VAHRYFDRLPDTGSTPWRRPFDAYDHCIRHCNRYLQRRLVGILFLRRPPRIAIKGFAKRKDVRLAIRASAELYRSKPRETAMPPYVIDRTNCWPLLYGISNSALQVVWLSANDVDGSSIKSYRTNRVVIP
jgi:hypothetical protein